MSDRSSAANLLEGFEDRRQASELARKIHELIFDDQIEDFRSKRGTCAGCGECCSRFLPITDEERTVIEWVVGSLGIKPTYRDTELSISMICPFLDEDRMCSIYEYRPSICKAYRCDEHKKGILRNENLGPSEKYSVFDMYEIFQ